MGDWFAFVFKPRIMSKALTLTSALGRHRGRFKTADLPGVKRVSIIIKLTAVAVQREKEVTLETQAAGLDLTANKASNVNVSGIFFHSSVHNKTHYSLTVHMLTYYTCFC